MLQPIRPTLNRNLSFRTTSAKKHNTQPISEKKSELVEYLEAKDKSDKQNQIILGGFSMLLTAGALAAFLKFGNRNSKAAKDKIDFASGFRSLKNDPDIPTLDTCKSINSKLKDFLQHQVNYANATQEDIIHTGNPNSANRIILYGAPGSGKSFFAKIYAKTLDADCKEIKYSDLNSQWTGEHLDNIKNTFEDVINTAQSKPNKKYVVILNEIDSLVLPVERLSRGSSGHSAFKVEERSVFLNYLDEIATKTPNVTIIGTTNICPKNKGLDGAAMSRFKNIMEVSYPNKECLNIALKESLSGLGDGKEFIKENEEQLKQFAKIMEDRKCSYRDLNNIVDTSKNYYLKDYLKDKNTKFKMEYLEKAQKAMDATDGEIAGNV